MKKCSFSEIQEKLIANVLAGQEPELSLYINGKEYMIIAYENHCSFQRCGLEGYGSGEINYTSLEELYNTERLMVFC